MKRVLCWTPVVGIFVELIDCDYLMDVDGHPWRFWISGLWHSGWLFALSFYLVS